MDNIYRRKFKDPTFKFNQNGRKGLDAPDVGKRGNLGES